MSDLIEQLDRVAKTLEAPKFYWDHEHAAAVREAIAEIKRLRKVIEPFAQQEITELLDASQSIMDWLGCMRCLWDDDAKQRIARLSMAIRRVRK